MPETQAGPCSEAVPAGGRLVLPNPLGPGMMELVGRCRQSLRRSEPAMTDLGNAIQAVEGGLLTANPIQGRSQQPLKLSERLAHYITFLRDRDDSVTTVLLGEYERVGRVGQSGAGAVPTHQVSGHCTDATPIT